MKIVYVVISYVVIAVVGFLGLRHIHDLNLEISAKKAEIASLKEKHKQVIEAYTLEIEQLTKTAKERKVVVKEITKLVKGTKDEECFNRTIPDAVLNKLRKTNSGKSTHSTLPKR